VKNVDPLGEPHRVHRSICIALMISDDLKDARVEALEGLRALVCCADLRKVKGANAGLMRAILPRSVSVLLTI
jgi:hypothetical protein